MARLDRLREHLPSLYRPDTSDTSSLVSRVLSAGARVLDTLDRETAEAMQAHWFTQADSALLSPFFLRAYQLREQPLPGPGSADLEQFPYVLDLARLASLLPLAPARGELVEAYRERIRRFVALYRAGLGTVGALRRMVEITLPISVGSVEALRDRPFSVEELSGVGPALHAIPARGEPQQRLAPLMRWTLENRGHAAVAPTVYIQALGTAERPLIELFSTGATSPRIGIGYRAALQDQTLRLQPLFSSWLLRAERIEVSPGSLVDPTAPGPWSPLAGVPVGNVVALERARDGAVLAAINAGNTGQVARFDGSAWNGVLSTPARIHALAGELVGTEAGLLRLSEPDTPLLAGRSVRAILRTRSGATVLASSGGLLELGAAQPVIAGAQLQALYEDDTGALFAGGELGLFQRREGGGLFWFSGEGASEQQPDWLPLTALPAAQQVFLPPVTAIHRGPDAWLWLGTEHGICRYGARSSNGLTFETVLEAFPELGTTRVHSIREDERGGLWFASEQGLFRYDGRDFWQLQGNGWVRLGKLAARGSFRFERAQARWQVFDFARREWRDFSGSAIASAEPPVRAVSWIDRIHAELGDWDGAVFSNGVPVPAEKLVTRFKPDAKTVSDGGLAAIPRLPLGESVWRYLSIEAEALAPPVVRPFWTTEGRLLSPPEAPEAPAVGQYDVAQPPPASDFDEAVFAYPPAARVWMQWSEHTPFSVLVRLRKLTADESLDPALLDQVWAGMNRVRPAGVKVLLAVEDELVRGN